ncbi:HAMP domain-containing protein [Mycobacterium sp. KBS0706]|uniref:adenylate/guanylate cyclase domain-containing protein n=1 Tax=Mycobacterium sp. KBS0706 TaxID=2578109 RepID=UPI00110F7C85|nr:adenylate/guanylate cyclase domain-containing protein [Mycobacterium sp. KBS0706]TSD84851.1 HAMP domain-containing protein [Mycobacterium sp. KBS0706]
MSLSLRRKLLSLSLRRKLLLFSVLIAAFPLLFAGQSLIRIARDEMKSAANERLVTTVREVTGQIDDIYERAWLAPLLLIRSAIDSDKISVGEKVAILTHGIAQLPDIVALQITLDGGRLPLVISQNRFSTRLTEAGIQPLNVLRAAPEVMLAAAAPDGEMAAWVTAVDYEPKTESWLATVILPLDTRFSGARAVLSAKIDLGRIRGFIESQPFRQVGMITTVDAEGRKLFDPELDESGRVKQLGRRDIISEALAARDGNRSRAISVETYLRPDGTPMLGTFAFTRSFDWAVVVEQKEADAYYAADVMIESLVFWLIGGLAVAVLGAAVFAHRISRPILAIGEAATEVAKGNYRVQVRTVHSRDEIGDLAKRINNMIVQINERFELAKFVSHGTMDAIQHSDETGVHLGGSRCEVAILFADIRGYTAFAESRDPETVVETLNFYLAAQADLVAGHNGDIDKFVGDQVMAVFQGPAMAADALRCAVAMQRHMAEASAASPDRNLAIGIGIDMGEVVMGAIGARDRMDFTVLGDHVNVAARLCSAAKPGQTLAAAAVVEAAASRADLPLISHALDPIILKGKSAPLEVYDIQPASQAAA